MADTPRDWYLRDWMTHLGLRQAQIVKDLGWDRSRVSKLFHSIQPYTRGDVDQLAAWMGIKPHELLLPPREAIFLRRIRETAAALVAEDGEAYEQAAPATRVGLKKGK